MADSAKNTKKVGFFKGIKVELKKISWPDKKLMFKQSVAVVAISVVMGFIIAVIDYLSKWGIDFLISL